MSKTKKVQTDTKAQELELNLMSKMDLLDAKLAKLDAWEQKLAEKEEEIQKKEENQKLPNANKTFGVSDDPHSGVPIDQMPLTSLREYRIYNERARKENKRLGVLRYPIKQCPVELHPTERIKFAPLDQPENAVPVFKSDHLIHFHKVLYPGKTYDLPVCIINYLESKGKPVWRWKEQADGTKVTEISHKVPRFSVNTVRDNSMYEDEAM